MADQLHRPAEEEPCRVATTIVFLPTLIRDEVAALLRGHGGRGRDVAKRVRASHGDLLDRLGGDLIDESVARRANREFKRSLDSSIGQSEQYVLPGFLKHIHDALPLSISVPPAEDDDKDPVYRPLFGRDGATIGELRSAIEALWKQITNDTRRARALDVLLDAVLSLGGADDERVGDVLKRDRPEAAE